MDIRNLFQSLPWAYSAPALSHMRIRPKESSENACMIQFFTWEARHPVMSWWKHFQSEVASLRDMGITQVWLPPPHKATRKTGQGYDAYDLWDLGEFDQKGTVATRWGTREELLDACKTAKEHQLLILIDAVLNHKMGADRRESFPAVPVDPTDRTKEIGKERVIQAWTAYDFTGRMGKYSDLRWTQEHFTGIDWDDSSKSKAIYKFTGEGHQGWSKHVDKELGNYDYLLGGDIDHRHPKVKEDLLAWGKWILETTGAGGYRLDAIKHMDRRFLLDFIKSGKARNADRDMFAVAEYWSGKQVLRTILPYVRAFRGQTTFFDVPLHFKFHQACEQGQAFDLRTIFNDTLVYCRPGDAVTFVDNHDTQIGQSLESWVDASFKVHAYALILLRPHGHPCAFYGDIYPNKECYDAAVARNVTKLLTARKLYAYGETVDYFLHKNCVGFVRRGSSSRPGCAVIISNGTMKSSKALCSIRMNMGLESVTKTYIPLLDSTNTPVRIDSKGWGEFYTKPKQVEVWIQE
ncbi:glycoside hydrolase family 13 protein [Coniophora puteana RWD-64-598 SS2]|uniref:Glycoside hydrolase family 13 protein n=1 Tax=Coniophora puteana (strain RWD-64-598) TaxID=741705 RepID=A0A5M3MYS2_CONPW|nr:glycoside hydrolase family 13 protein [Coniophora puteana RWD-64-598 SS2]EIW84269.1 glycoside hydrolase family 13 protein [Coniophora puteana RWD-64-598 SS2]